MNRFVILCVVVSAVAGIALFSCSSTPGFCSTASNAGTTLQSKFGSCDAGGTLTFNNCTGSFQSQCTTAYDSCTSADQTVLNNESNCINNQPSCTPGMETAWFTTYLGCLTDAGTPSSACLNAFAAIDAGNCG